MYCKLLRHTVSARGCNPPLEFGGSDQFGNRASHFHTAKQVAKNPRNLLFRVYLAARGSSHGLHLLQRVDTRPCCDARRVAGDRLSWIWFNPSSTSFWSVWKMQLGKDAVQCSPLHTLHELNQWEPPTAARAGLTAASVPLPSSISLRNCPYAQRMLFCHDMAGVPSLLLGCM